MLESWSAESICAKELSREEHVELHGFIQWKEFSRCFFHSRYFFPASVSVITFWPVLKQDNAVELCLGFWFWALLVWTAQSDQNRRRLQAKVAVGGEDKPNPLNFLRILFGMIGQIGCFCLIMSFSRLCILWLVQRTEVYGLLLLTESVVAGGTAGVVVEAALYPIDTIKTRLQVMSRYVCSFCLFARSTILKK